MLDPNLKVEKKEAVDFKPLPENIYQVELLDITSEERATYDTRNNPEETREMETVLKFQFTLLSGKDGEESLRGRSVWENFVPTYLYIGKKGKNKLYKVVEALRGKELDQTEEAEGVDGAFLNALIGKQCRVGIKHTKKDDKTYDNIETYYRVDEFMQPLSEEEKEKARVKKDEKDSNDEIDLDAIPF